MISYNSSGLGTTPLVATAAMPSTSMKIYRGEPVEGRVAESVKIGDPLTMVISIDNQDIYGMHISGCSVRDGLGWSEQGLINDEGLDFNLKKKLEKYLIFFSIAVVPWIGKLWGKWSTVVPRLRQLCISKLTDSPILRPFITNVMSDCVSDMLEAVRTP